MDENKNKVSVIIPTYNYGHFVSSAIESALAQTYKNLEIIVVDDGSRDNTKDIVEKYKDKINYIYQENKGLSAARNTGITCAKGGYIALLDADDVWMENKIELQIKAFEADSAVGIVSCNANKVNEENKIIDEIVYQKYSDDNKFSKKLFIQNIVSGGSSAVIRRECFDKCGLFDESLRSAEDWDMWLRVNRHYKIRILDDKLLNIAVGSDNMSSVKNAQKMLDNELKVLRKQFDENEKIKNNIFMKNSAFSYRYFCAAWAFYMGKKLDIALHYILRSFARSPISFLNKKQGGLMVKIIIKNVLKASIPVNKITKPVFKFIYSVHVFLREAFIVAIKFFYYEPLFRSQCKTIGSGLWMEQLPYITGKGVILIGDNVRLSGKPYFVFSSKVYPNPEVLIGDNTFIGHAVRFHSAKNIEIGENCYIAGGTVLADNDGHPLHYEDRRENKPPLKEDVRDVIVGNDVWIGREAVILKGVTIGDRAIVGARAVVTKNVEEGAIVAGNPAKNISKNR